MDTYLKKSLRYLKRAVRLNKAMADSADEDKALRFVRVERKQEFNAIIHGTPPAATAKADLPTEGA